MISRIQSECTCRRPPAVPGGGADFLPIMMPGRGFRPGGFHSPANYMLARPTLLLLAAVVPLLVGCQEQKTEKVTLPTTPVTRGNIAVRVQATGTVEPINPVDIK